MEKGKSVVVSVCLPSLTATRPDTAGFVTMNSPAGLAAYIIEKFHYWSGCLPNDSADCLGTRFTKDELLTNVMIYWLTETMPSAMRLYLETFRVTILKSRYCLVLFVFWLSTVFSSRLREFLQGLKSLLRLEGAGMV